MQILNTFVLLISSVIMLFAGITAGKISKRRRFRAIIGVLAPLLMLSALYVLVEMMVGGYAETSATLVPENYLFLRYAFTGLIFAFVLASVWSLVALIKREKIGETLAFLIGVGFSAVVAAAVSVLSVTESFSAHSAIIIPSAVIFFVYEVFALANTLLETDKKHRKIILYAVNVISALAAGFVSWFVFTPFAAESATGGLGVVIIIFAVFMLLIIAGPIAAGLISSISEAISGFKYVKKEDKKEPDDKDKIEESEKTKLND